MAFFPKEGLNAPRNQLDWDDLKEQYQMKEWTRMKEDFEGHQFALEDKLKELKE